MRSFVERLFPALLVVAVLIGVANLGAYAATGSPLILGMKNFSPKTTVLESRGDHATLRLLTNGGPPLSVQPGSGRVRHLDVDKVDGADASDLGVEGTRILLEHATSETGQLKYFLPVQFGYGGVYVSYSVLLETTGTQVACYWEVANYGRGHGVEQNGVFTVSGTATVNGDEDPPFHCVTEPGETLQMLGGSSITAIRQYNGHQETIPACVPETGSGCY